MFFIYMLTLLPKGVQKNNKKFSDWRFFPFATGVVCEVANLELRMSPRIIEKIQNGPNGIIRDLGETDS